MAFNNTGSWSTRPHAAFKRPQEGAVARFLRVLNSAFSSVDLPLNIYELREVLRPAILKSGPLLQSLALTLIKHT